MNHNRRDEPALLGTFGKSSYISFGTNESPCLYGVKAPDRDNFKGKQFKANPPPTGKLPSIFYEKEHPWVAKDLPYSDRIKYADIQPEKPGKGFGTSDYSRRDEFSNTTRTEQYRSQMKSEGKFAKKALQSASPRQQTTAAATAVPERPLKTRQTEPVFLYDLVHETCPSLEEDLAATKRRHDTKNPVLLSKDRFNGPYETSTGAAYGPASNFSKSPHGRTKLVGSTFYRRANVFFPDSSIEVLA